jgi:hypothetical protein
MNNYPSVSRLIERKAYIMDPLTMILSALTAGAVAALKDTATAAVQDLYAGLKALIQKKFADKPLAKSILDEHAKDPETYAKPLEKNLKESAVDQDQAIVQKAQELLEAIKASPAGGDIITQTANITGNARVGQFIQVGKVEGGLTIPDAPGK